MAYLIRTDSGRNDIEFSGDSDVAGRYLKRTGSSVENIDYVDIITSNNSMNIIGLNRIGAGRNDIDWQNLTFSFVPDYKDYIIDMFEPVKEYGAKVIGRIKNDSKGATYVKGSLKVANRYGNPDNQWYTLSESDREYLSLNTDLEVREMVFVHDDQNTLNMLKDHFDNYRNNSNYKVRIQYSQSEPEYGSNDPVSTNYLYLKDVYLSTKYTGSNDLILVWSQSPTAMYGNIYIHSSFAIYMDI